MHVSAALLHIRSCSVLVMVMSAITLPLTLLAANATMDLRTDATLSFPFSSLVAVMLQPPVLQGVLEKCAKSFS